MKGAFIMRKRKYTAEIIMKIVDENLNEGTGTWKLEEKYGIDRSTIRTWIVQYMTNGISAFVRDGKNKIYSEELKAQAVKDYLGGCGSIKTITAKYGLRSTKQLHQWIKMYNSGRGFRHKMSGGSRMKEARSTTVEERIQIAQDCIANGGNYGETAFKFNVSYQQVYQWVKKYKEMGDAGLEDRRGKRKKDQTPRTELEKAQIEIERLKHELYMTQMERDLLKKLDEIERREAYRK